MRNNGERGGGENEEREQNEIEKLRIGNRERYPATSAGFFFAEQIPRRRYEKERNLIRFLGIKCFVFLA